MVKICAGWLKAAAQRGLWSIEPSIPRGNWGGEKGLHRELDIAFQKDESRERKDHGPENLTVPRIIAVSLLTQERALKVHIKPKQLNAAYHGEYPLKVQSWVAVTLVD